MYNRIFILREFITVWIYNFDFQSTNLVVCDICYLARSLLAKERDPEERRRLKVDIEAHLKRQR